MRIKKIVKADFAGPIRFFFSISSFSCFLGRMKLYFSYLNPISMNCNEQLLYKVKAGYMFFDDISSKAEHNSTGKLEICHIKKRARIKD